MARRANKRGIERDITEAMAIHYVAAELSRRDWRVFLPLSGRVRGYDFVAWKGRKSRRVEVTGLRSSGPRAWRKPLEPDGMIVGGGALYKRPPRNYFGTSARVKKARRYKEQRGLKQWAG